jgi:hypothetical protein
MPDRVGYATLDEAAKAALLAALPLSEKHEYAGAIYEQDGKFYFTEPATSGGSHSVSVRVRKPKGSTLAALYHVHPEDKTGQAGNDSSVFSEMDIEVSDKLKVPYYMAHTKDGAMSVFLPGKSRVVKLRHPIKMKFSKGESLGLAEAFKAALETKEETNLGDMFTGNK